GPAPAQGRGAAAPTRQQLRRHPPPRHASGPSCRGEDGITSTIPMPELATETLVEIYVGSDRAFFVGLEADTVWVVRASVGELFEALRLVRLDLRVARIRAASDASSSTSCPAAMLSSCKRAGIGAARRKWLRPLVSRTRSVDGPTRPNRGERGLAPW